MSDSQFPDQDNHDHDDHDVPDPMDTVEDGTQGDEPVTTPDEIYRNSDDVIDDGTFDDETTPDEEDYYVPEQSPHDFVETYPTTEDLPESNRTTPLAMVREAYETLDEVLARHESLIRGLRDAANRSYQTGTRLIPEQDLEWMAVLTEAERSTHDSGVGEDALARKSEWRQKLDYEGTELRAGYPRQARPGSESGNEKLYLANKSGVSSVFDVPLYASGIWLRFQTPPLAAIASLEVRLNELKVNVGTLTRGVSFSNQSQTTTSLAVDFAIHYVVAANVHYKTPSDLKEKILITDISALLWGLACTLYPKGFPYSHPCVADIKNCRHVIRERLKLSRLFWTDTLSLTEHQLSMMSQRFRKKWTDDELKRYRSEQLRGNDRQVFFENSPNPNLGVVLKLPTVAEYEASGIEWIEEMIQNTANAFNEPPHGSQRNDYITRLSAATAARQYGHWVRAVVSREDEEDTTIETYEEHSTVIDFLGNVVSTDEYLNEFDDKVRQFMNDAIISMVAVPSINCPSCDTPQAEKFHERFPHLIPLDVVMTFFTLASRKLS